MEPTATPETQALPRYPANLPKILDYPATTGVLAVVVCTIVLLIVSKRFDASGGAFTIALIVVLSFVGMSAFSMLFTIPQDEETATIIGGLVAAFGAVIAFWLKSRSNGGDK